MAARRDILSAQQVLAYAPKQVPGRKHSILDLSPFHPNWFYAVGGYRAYGSARVRKLPDCTFKMSFGFHFDDMYNWDASKWAPVGGVNVKDTELGRLHQVGLAQEFHMTGTCTKTVNWCFGQRFDSEGNLLSASAGTSAPPTGGRD